MASQNPDKLFQLTKHTVGIHYMTKL